MTDHTGRCTEAQTPAPRQALGAYVLGALDQAETDQVTAHLAHCPGCHEEYLELLDLVPLLASVTEADVVRGPLEPGPEVLDQTLAAWRRDATDPRRTTATNAEPHERPAAPATLWPPPAWQCSPPSARSPRT